MSQISLTSNFALSCVVAVLQNSSCHFNITQELYHLSCNIIECQRPVAVETHLLPRLPYVLVLGPLHPREHCPYEVQVHHAPDNTENISRLWHSSEIYSTFNQVTQYPVIDIDDSSKIAPTVGYVVDDRRGHSHRQDLIREVVDGL